jgi:hypothetical protein
MMFDVALAFVTFALATVGVALMRRGKRIGRVLLGLAVAIAAVATVGFQEPGVAVGAAGGFLLIDAFDLEPAHRVVAFMLLGSGIFGLLSGGYLIGG